MLRLLIAGLLATAFSSITPVYAADVVYVEIAPPPPRVEVVPAPRTGYVWAPGYWRWESGRHVWVEGRPIEAREGSYWVPDRWTEYRD